MIPDNESKKGFKDSLHDGEPKLPKRKPPPPPRKVQVYQKYLHHVTIDQTMFHMCVVRHRNNGKFLLIYLNMQNFTKKNQLCVRANN